MDTLMKHPNTQRILTTHVGSLPRPRDLLDLMKAKVAGIAPDAQLYEGRSRSAVVECAPGKQALVPLMFAFKFRRVSLSFVCSRGIMNRAVLTLTFAVFLVSAVTAQQEIPTGGRIPDRRGFNNSVDDPKLTSQVEEVVRKVAGNVYEHITPLPNAPAFVDGVVFTRVEVIPAVNLRVRFGFNRIPHTTRTRLIVTNTNGRTIGLLVDSAREFMSISNEAIQPPPDSMTGLSGKYLKGIVTIGDRVVLIIDLDELVKVDQVRAAALET